MWPNPLETAGLVTFTEEIPNGKLRFLCSEMTSTKVTFWAKTAGSKIFFFYFINSENVEEFQLVECQFEQNCHFNSRLGCIYVKISPYYVWSHIRSTNSILVIFTLIVDMN